MARRRAVEVALKRDENWWLHPVLRGQQSLPLNAGAGAMPHRWVRSDGTLEPLETSLEVDSPYADFAKILYRLNGARPGPVRGFYVIVEIEKGRFAVGQLCADPALPVHLFEDLVYPCEAQARTKAAELRALAPGIGAL
ncbi:MAG: hypothetical protein EXR83_02315 [Gammaproteobacteria bacterium]|nr:hypothetical protein [Gammaproteobacteria bacterium]